MLSSPRGTLASVDPRRRVLRTKVDIIGRISANDARIQGTFFVNTIEPTVLYSLAAIFLASSALNISGPAFIREEFRNWHYPPWLRYAVGCCELGAAAGFVIPGYQAHGALLAIAVLIGVFVSLLRTREWLRMMLPAILASLSISLLVDHWDLL